VGHNGSHRTSGSKPRRAGRKTVVDQTAEVLDKGEHSLVVEMAREMTIEAIQVLAGIMRNGKEESRIACAKALLDRGWGAASKSIPVSSGGLTIVVNRFSDAPEERAMREIAQIPADIIREAPAVEITKYDRESGNLA